MLKSELEMLANSLQLGDQFEERDRQTTTKIPFSCYREAKRFDFAVLFALHHRLRPADSSRSRMHFICRWLR